MLENNKIYQMNCLDFLRKIESNSISLLVLDPPYNLHRFDYGNKSDFMGEQKYFNWCQEWFKECTRILKSNGSMYIWISRQNLGFYQVELSKLLKYRNTIIWNFTNGASYQRSKNYDDRFEACLFFTKSDEYIFNKDKYFIPFNPESLVQNVKNLKSLAFYKKKSPAFLKKVFIRMKEQGKLMINVWNDIAHITNTKKITGHINEKPVRLVERCILMSSNEGDTVLDCFGGSGTTYIAALKNKRNFIGCEIEEKWVKAINQRIEAYKIK